MLEQVGVLRTVLVAHRLSRFVEGFFVRRNELDAFRLQLIGCLRGLLVPQRALLELGLARDLHEERLVFLGERLPGALGEDEDLGNDQVAGQAVYLAYLIVVLRQHGRLVVLRAVYHARLQGAIELVEAHRHAVAAHRVHGIDEDGVAHHADLHALEIGGFGDRLVRVHVAGASVHPTESDEARLARRHPPEQVLPDRAVDNVAHVVNHAPREAPSSFHSRLVAGFVSTVELDVPRGLDMSSVLEGAAFLKTHGVDAVNISDGARARLRMSPIAISQLVQTQVGIECIAHLACRDRNMVGLQSELLGAHAMGVRNVLAVTGDPTHIGDFPGATSVYDVDSVGLVRALGRMNQGQDLMGNPLGDPASFCIACAVNPAADDLEREVDRLAAKAAEGAHVAFSQPVFDVDLLERFLDRTKHIGIALMLGVIPLRSIRHAEFLHYEVPGMTIPEWVRERMRSAGADSRVASEIGIEIAVNFLRQVTHRINGVYLMPPFKKYDVAVTILQQIQPNGVKRAG